MGQELEQYKKDGFYVAKKIIDKSAITETLASLTKTLADQLKFLGKTPSGDIFENLKSLHDRDIERYKKTVGAIWRKESVNRLMQNPGLINFMKDKFGWDDLFMPGGQVVHIMAEELKIPGGYFGLNPHQDFPSVQGSIDGAVVWIPLTDVDLDNYPLEVLPKSHMKGMLPLVNETDYKVDPASFNPGEFVKVPVQAGDVIFMSMFTLHQSSLDGTLGKLRLAVSTRYDNANEETFIERAYPTAYQRNVHREQYIKDFPSQELISKVFG